MGSLQESNSRDGRAGRVRPAMRSAMSSDIPPLPRGDLLTPMDLGWEEARRVANGRMQGRPALVARCLGVADVCAALRLAQDRRLIISVRGGGHSVAGWATNDGGLVIDLTRMRGAHGDPNEATAWIGGGALAIDVIF